METITIIESFSTEDTLNLGRKMGKLVINQNLINPLNADGLIKLCPFGAISYNGSEIEISSACKMCKLCVKKSSGLIEYEEETVAEIDKSEWNGICVYADASGGQIHRVTFELCGKAQELARVTGHPIYAVLIGYNCKTSAEKLLNYGEYVLCCYPYFSICHILFNLNFF